MKVHFIYHDPNYVKDYMPDYRGSISFGIAYLSSYLKKKGHQVTICHLLDDDITVCLKSIAEAGPDLLAFNAFTHNFDSVRSLIAAAKKDFDIPVILGGVHATIDPEGAIKNSDTDMICLGEGELALSELCDRIQKGSDYLDVKSLWLKDGDKIIRNPARPLIEDLDSIPFPDREIFRLDEMVQAKMGSIDVLATRGCPYDCSYCCNHQYKKLYKGQKYVRFRSVSNVIDEIQSVIANSKDNVYTHVVLIDDTFGLNKTWLREFCNEYKQRISVPWRANSHANILKDYSIVKALKDSGCEMLAIAIESGDRDLRYQVLNKKVTDEVLEAAFKNCHEAGIELLSYNMVGLPFETKEKALKTIKFNARLVKKTRLMHVSILQPYINTNVYDLCLEHGMLSKDTTSTSFFGNSVITQEGFTKDDTLFFYKYFYLFVKIYRLLFRLPFGYKMAGLADKVIMFIEPKKAIKCYKYLYPVFFPIQNMKKKLLKYSPNLARKIKKSLKLIKRPKDIFKKPNNIFRRVK